MYSFDDSADGWLRFFIAQELVKIMPGYYWTVHTLLFKDTSFLEATGIQSSGFNRLSTLNVVRREKGAIRGVWYEVKSAGSGTKSQWLAERGGGTLAQALRSLQTHYENMAQTYRAAASYLQNARKKAEE